MTTEPTTPASLPNPTPRSAAIAGGVATLVVVVVAIGLRGSGDAPEERAKADGQLAELEDAGLGPSVGALAGESEPARSLQASLRDRLGAREEDWFGDPDAEMRDWETLQQYPDQLTLFARGGVHRDRDLHPDVRTTLEGAVRRGERLLDAILAADGMALPDGAVALPTPVSELSIIGQARQLLEFRALLAADARDRAAAWEVVEAQAKLVRVCDWPTLMGQKIRAETAASLAESVVALLSLGAPDAATRSRVDGALRDLDDGRQLQRALRGELDRNLFESRLWAGEAEPIDGLDIFWNAEHEAPLETILADRASIIGLSGRLIRAATGDAHALRAEAEAVSRDRRALPTDHVIATLENTAEVIVLKDLEARARLRLARMALALAAEDELPLRPPLSLPDPFAGGDPLIWTREDARVGTLRSAGYARSDPTWRDDGAPLGEEPPRGTFIRLQLAR